MNISAKFASIPLERMKGIMFDRDPAITYLETRYGIHTFFVQCKIDVYVLDNKSVVKVVKKDLYPFRIFFWNPKYYRILEIPEGKNKKIKVGTKINLKLL